MELFATLDAPLFLLFLGFGAWLSIAVANNIIDRGTNIFLLGIMLSMKLLKEDALMGNGLKQRAIDSPGFHRAVLFVVILVQSFLAGFLLITAANYLGAWFGHPFASPRGLGNLATMAFVSLWLFFMSGGLWYGYWMKQVQVQQVHMTLVLFSLGLFILVNMPA